MKIALQAWTGLAIALLVTPFPASAEEAQVASQFRIHLIHAQNVRIEDDDSIPADLRKKLVTLFGYERYQTLGKAVSQVSAGQPARFSPSDMFHMRMTQLTPDKSTFQFELMQHKKMVFRGKFTPKPKIPILIRGPFYDEGNLILVIHHEK